MAVRILAGKPAASMRMKSTVRKTRKVLERAAARLLSVPPTSPITADRSIPARKLGSEILTP